MSRNKITDYSNTAEENEDIGGIGIRGSDPVRNMDNALREIMSHLADMNAGDEPLEDTFTLADADDVSRKAKFDLGNITSGNTRVLEVPDESGKLLIDTALLDENGNFLGDITGNAATADNATRATDADNADNATAHIAEIGNPHGLTAADIDLGNVTNTSDTDKPISTVQAQALALKADTTYVDNQIANLDAGIGFFKGNNGEVGSGAGDIFRVNSKILTVDTTIDSDENASCTGPLEIAETVNLTIADGGNLAVI